MSLDRPAPSVGLDFDDCGKPPLGGLEIQTFGALEIAMLVARKELGVGERFGRVVE